jgi:hypothetical protein
MGTRSVWVTLLFTVFLFSSFVTAQERPVELFGQVKELDDTIAIHHASIVALDLDDRSFRISAIADSTGNYAMLLPYGRLYQVEAASAAHVGRHVLIDLRQVPPIDRRKGFRLHMDPVLFKRMDGIDYSLFTEEPAGICLFDPIQKTLVWDAAYIESTKKLVQSVLDQQRSRSQEPSPAAD